MFTINTIFSDGLEMLDSRFETLDECIAYVKSGEVENWVIYENGIELVEGVDFEL